MRPGTHAALQPLRTAPLQPFCAWLGAEADVIWKPLRFAPVLQAPYAGLVQPATVAVETGQRVEARFPVPKGQQVLMGRWLGQPHEVSVAHSSWNVDLLTHFVNVTRRIAH